MRYLVEIHVEIEAESPEEAYHLADVTRKRLLYGRLARKYINSYVLQVRERIFDELQLVRGGE